MAGVSDCLSLWICFDPSKGELGLLCLQVQP